MNTPLPTNIGRPATNALIAAGITCLEDVAKHTEAELAALHGVGPKAIGILTESLRQHNTELSAPKKMKKKESELIDGFLIKYHANGVTRWSKGKLVDGLPDGYWEWYRIDGTIKRSGYFVRGEVVGEWITYDSQGNVYKVTNK
jgi:hypothetical protein